MYRDFTYVGDLVRGIRLLIDVVPERREDNGSSIAGDSLSPVAPFRIVNIGNGQKVKLLEFVDAIEKVIGIPAKRHMMDMQKGDVPETWSDNSLLHSLTGYRPNTSVEEGVAAFVSWYREYYRK